MKKFFIGFFVIIVVIVVSMMIFTEIHPSNKTFNDECNKGRHTDVELKTKLSDKFGVKGYLSDNFPDVKFAKVLHQIHTNTDIDKLHLPPNFILKNSTGCGDLKIIKNNKIISKGGRDEGAATKPNLSKSIEEIKQSETMFHHRLRAILFPHVDFSEPQYDNIEPRIFIEEYLESVNEFRMYYKRDKLLVIEWLGDGGRDGDYYTRNWEQVPNIFTGKVRGRKHPKPGCLDQILKFGDEFTEKNTFPVLRLDLYLKNDGSDFYFGEFTFCPSNCVKKFTSDFQNSFKQISY